MAATIDSRSGTVKRALLFLACFLLAGSAIAWWVWLRPGALSSKDAAPPDPRLSYDGPFLNVHPDVRFVGDAKCADCHLDICETYARHPMGCTLSPSRDLTPTQALTAKQNHPVRVGNFRYRVLADKGAMTHRIEQLDTKGEPILTQDHEVHYRVGSGTRGYSYFTEIDGRVFQTPISWFSGKDIWDISPGFDPFTPKLRPIPTSCLFCHSNRVRPHETQANRFQPGVFDGFAIGCERCHGPGEEHVALRERAEKVPGDDPYDRTIVNPKHLSWQLRENVCQQCHLKGQVRVSPWGREAADFRPGMPLEQFLAVYVDADAGSENRTAVNHVEQMYQSKCFTKTTSERKLGCISCHDPHRKAEPAERISYFRKKCMECHSEASCKEPRPNRLKLTPQDSCIDCHMPRYSASDIAHTAVTDHRIVRRPSPPKPGGKEQPRNLALFHEDRSSPTTSARKRDLAIAYSMLRGLAKGEPGDSSEKVIDLLRGYHEANPGDADAWQASGLSLFLLRREDEAETAFRAELRLRPESELALFGLASVAQRRASTKSAARYFREAIEINPHGTYYREQLARSLKILDDTQGELEQFQHWLRLEPFSAKARRGEYDALRRLGRREESENRLELMRRLRISPEGRSR